MVDRVKADVSKRNLILTPRFDGAEVEDTSTSEFEVTVTNESREFASFQLELSTSGVASDAIEEWYRIEPEVCTKKPPGASTTFRVVILRSPLPVYDTTIDVLLRVFSVEFRQLHTTQKLSLTIRKPQQPLNLVLPNPTFKATPGDAVEIPVLVYNYSANAIPVTLRCSGFPADWLPTGVEQQVRVDSGYPAKVSFTCQLPDSPQFLRQTLPFTIEALSNVKGRIPTVEGTLEVLPLGTIEFRCSPKRQQVPNRRQSITEPASTHATYQLELKNASNAPQRVQIAVTDFDQQQCNLTLPDDVRLDPAETKWLPLISRKVRPWIGRKQVFRFDVNAEVLDLASDQVNNSHREGTTSQRVRAVPTHQTLELQVLPIVPLWLLLLGSGLLLALLWLMWLFNPQPNHQAPVNSVRLDGNASTVFSGSNDQTVLRWQVDNDFWEPPARRLKYENDITQGQFNKAVRVIRLSPTDNNVIVAGLENGDIRLLDVLGNQTLSPLFKGTDRVFDLDFSPDAHYLFSGHGSSRIRQWDFQTKNPAPLRTIITNFAISSLSVDQNLSSSWVAIAGRFNKLMLWDWFNRVIYEVPYDFNMNLNQDSNLKFAPVLGQHHYIESVATTNDLLVTADNQGYMTVWNLRDRDCRQLSKTDVQVLERLENRRLTRLKTGECNLAILDQWADGHEGKAVRSIAITSDSHYLASVGDDGRVKLWLLDNGRRSSKWKQGKILAHYPGTRLHSVDIKASKVAGDYLFVTSDAPNNQVRLYRESMNLHAN